MHKDDSQHQKLVHAGDQQKTKRSINYTKILLGYSQLGSQNKKIHRILPIFHNDKVTSDFNEKTNLFNSFFAS